MLNYIYLLSFLTEIYCSVFSLYYFYHFAFIDREWRTFIFDCGFNKVILILYYIIKCKALRACSWNEMGCSKMFNFTINDFLHCFLSLVSFQWQIATKDNMFMFDMLGLGTEGFVDGLQALLESSDVIKVGRVICK